MDVEETEIRFLSGTLTQRETVNLLYLLALAADPENEEAICDAITIREDLRFLDVVLANSLPLDRDVRIILRKLEIIPRKLIKVDEESTKTRRQSKKSKDSLVTKQSMEDFLNKEASQQETIAILVHATHDYAVKSFVMEADKNGQLDKNTRSLFKRLGVLPVTCGYL